MYTEILNMTKEYVKQADDCFEKLGCLKKTLSSVVREIRQQKKEENKNGNQSHAG